MLDNSIAVFINPPAHYRSSDSTCEYYFNRNFFYFSGITQENSALIITKTNNIFDTTIFVADNDSLKARWYGRTLPLSSVASASGIKESKIKNIETFSFYLSKMIKDLNPTELYLDFAPLASEFSPERLLEKTINADFPSVNILNSYPLTVQFRLIKEKEEINIIKESIDLTAQGIDNILANLHKRNYEYQLAADFAHIINLNNVALGFPTIIASGSSALCLHHSNLVNSVNKEDLLLIDLGASYLGYSADISRTYPVNGKFTPLQKKIYNAVLNIQKKTIKAIKPGVSWKDINLLSQVIAKSELLKINLIKEEQKIENYFWHSIGHSLGLDTHDISLPSDQLILKPGMVMTVEPGLYFPEYNIGVRIEDDILVTEKGCNVLSNKIKKSVNDIEKMLGGKHD